MERPLLIKLLKKYRPANINMPTLLEVLDTQKGKGVSDIEVDKFLSAPATTWKENKFKNLSANVDSVAAAHRASEEKLKKLYEEKVGDAPGEVYEQVKKLSEQLGTSRGIYYKHDPYQATVAACTIAKGKKFTLVTLPTSCGKTFVIGLTFQYYRGLQDKKVAAVVPNQELKMQMIDQLGLMGRGLTVLTRSEFLMSLG